MPNVNEYGLVGTFHHDIVIYSHSPKMFGPAMAGQASEPPGLWFLAISSTGTLYGAGDVTHVRSVLHHQFPGFISAAFLDGPPPLVQKPCAFRNPMDKFHDSRMIILMASTLGQF